MSKRFLALLAVIIVVVIGIIWISGNKNKANAPSNSKPTSHVEGQGKAGIKLVEYGDYECPYCGQYYPVLKQVASIYNSQITFQFRNLPLTQIHPNAFAAARAAEAAGLQGKFWQMHDALYAEQNQWVSATSPNDFFNQYAQQLGLNVAKFKQDFASEQVNNAINADTAAFNKTGAQEATPAFFLNGKQIQPNITLAAFETVLNKAIKAKGFTPPASAQPQASSSTNTPAAGTSKQPATQTKK